MPPVKGETEVDKFFEGLPSEEKQESDIFADPNAVAPAAEKQGEGETIVPEKDGEPRKNRRHRRLEQQLQEERELRIAAEARAEGRNEVQKFVQTTGVDDTPDKWLRMYGDTPESRQAWILQKELMADVVAKTKAETIAEIREEEKARVAEQKQFETFIENELETLEDEYNIDLTSDAPAAKKARREFLEMVQTLSPKDESGTITGYADFDETFKMYQDKRKEVKPDATKNKDLAARAMTRPGDSANGAAEKPRTPGFFGWQKDLGDLT